MSIKVFCRLKSIGLSLSTLALILLVAGCDTETKEETSDDTAANQDDGHGHHHHEHGPNGGELFPLADSGFYGEWKGKYDQNLIEFYIWDGDKETAKPIKTPHITIKTKGREPKTFTVTAVSPDADGLASQFQLEDETMAMEMKNNGVDFEIEIDGKQYTGFIPKDPH